VSGSHAGHLERWVNQYGGMKGDDAKRLKEAERFDQGPLPRQGVTSSACLSSDTTDSGDESALSEC
jgi:hypothetical protein